MFGKSFKLTEISLFPKEFFLSNRESLEKNWYAHFHSYATLVTMNGSMKGTISGFLTEVEFFYDFIATIQLCDNEENHVL